jgi:gliding motility-associated-like protein
MIVQIKRIILLLWIICLPIQLIFSQHSSKNNYTGAWETPTSWSPTWAVPQTTINPYDITINGYITVNSSLSFSGTSDLIINDTLVINGDLSLNDNCDLTINNNAILIVRGSVSFHNHSDIIANGYLIITGDVDKSGPFDEGSCTSNDNPNKVFIGGNISPFTITNNEPNFPAFNCTAPIPTRYPHSHCSHGDMTDLISDLIYPFFQSTCIIATPIITAGGPTTFCSGGSLTLTSSAGTTYLWSTGATTSSINITVSGSYTVKVTNASVCQSTASDALTVTVNDLPATPTITAGGPTTFCTGGSVTLTSNAGSTYLWSTGATTASINVTTAGSYTVKVKNANGCQSAVSTATIVVVNEKAVAVAGPDQELKFNFETQMNAQLSASETGDWSLISGSGHISDIRSPTTRVTGLSIGENIFSWKVIIGNCEDSAKVKITVHNVFVPSVITPNGDGKNDYFRISEFTGKADLIIVNQWGNEEYSNNNYSNDWDGRNNKGLKLPEDTYFYILKFGNGKILKGSVFIKR